MYKGNVSFTPPIQDITHYGFDSDALADTLEWDIKSSGPAFCHVSSFVQTAKTQSTTGGRQGMKLTS